MNNLFDTPQPSQEYKERQEKLIRDTILEIGIVDELQKGSKEPSPQQSGSIVENIIKSLGL
ncbi:RNA-binding protein [Dysgonomonas macrotermitis]|uniref:Uncharacterized protein n=1 Tax=Dysgonomonas macrotermitis TaxID=1346286 RepID=A0A1M4XYL6_9BACT|nr:hypothetical protein [Dysgonomonas macrotermitis]SHE98342.1 hypothetical protein SAMN05444362_10319 [Dysgonomonas macrotermitis]